MRIYILHRYFIDNKTANVIFKIITFSLLLSRAMALSFYFSLSHTYIRSYTNYIHIFMNKYIFQFRFQRIVLVKDCFQRIVLVQNKTFMHLKLKYTLKCLLIEIFNIYCCKNLDIFYLNVLLWSILIAPNFIFPEPSKQISFVYYFHEWRIRRR